MVEPVIEQIKAGQIGILPTDTMYGLVGSAFNPKTVERIYKVRQRNPQKPFIVLISSINELEKFNIEVTDLRQQLEHYWPGPVSIILPCPNKQWEYLHRGTQQLAFRLPNKPDLIEVLKETGPLVAPSANLEGCPPAKTIQEAKAYFGYLVDFYVDEGMLDSPPSTLMRFDKGQAVVLRP